jgi:hypothetical protein
MDPATLAAAALTAVAPYLLGLGKIAAEEGAKGAGKSVFDWIKGRLTSAAGKEAVEDAEKAPEASENVRALEAALTKALAKDPEAAAELQKLLASSPGVSGGQNVNVTGSGNKVGQADRRSSVSIS